MAYCANCNARTECQLRNNQKQSPLRDKQRKLRKGMDQRNILLNHQNYPAANYPMFAPVPGIDAPHVKYEQQVHAMGENTHTMHEQTISTVSTAQNDICDEDLQIKKSASWSDWLKAIQKKVTPIFAYVDPRGLFKWGLAFSRMGRNLKKV